MISACHSCNDGTSRSGGTCAACHGTARIGQPQCPECASWDVERGHHHGSFAVPECDYWQCEMCSKQWGHE